MGPETELETRLQHVSKGRPGNRPVDNLQQGLKAIQEAGLGTGTLCHSSGQERRLGPELGGRSTGAHRHRVFGWRPRVRLARAITTQ